MAVTAKFEIVGQIKDFGQVDNAYLAMKREAVKLFASWNIAVNVEYSETSPQGETLK